MNGGCKVCDSVLHPFGSARVLGRHEVRYYRCDACGFVQTEHPYWLDEAYDTALIAADVGVAQRNIELAAVTQVVIQQFFRADGRFLDYGGGYGLFVRLMRDRGFDFRWHDRYAPNLLSRGFEAAADTDGFELVTEVLGEEAWRRMTARARLVRPGKQRAGPRAQKLASSCKRA